MELLELFTSSIGLASGEPGRYGALRAQVLIRANVLVTFESPP